MPTWCSHGTSRIIRIAWWTACHIILPSTTLFFRRRSATPRPQVGHSCLVGKTSIARHGPPGRPLLHPVESGGRGHGISTFTGSVSDRVRRSRMTRPSLRNQSISAFVGAILFPILCTHASGPSAGAGLPGGAAAAGWVDSAQCCLELSLIHI